MFWAEIKQLWDEGAYNYFHDIWNLMDILMIAFYTAAFTLWAIREFRYRGALAEARKIDPNVDRYNFTFADNGKPTVRYMAIGLGVKISTF
jgi:hypothetical protein